MLNQGHLLSVKRRERSWLVRRTTRRVTYTIYVRRTTNLEPANGSSDFVCDCEQQLDTAKVSFIRWLSLLPYTMQKGQYNF